MLMQEDTEEQQLPHHHLPLSLGTPAVRSSSGYGAYLQYADNNYRNTDHDEADDYNY